MASKADPKRPRSRVAGFFLRGIAALLPIALTAFVFIAIFRFAHEYVTQPINRTIYWALESNAAGWQVLDWLGVEPLDAELIDKAGLPPALHDLADRHGLASPEFQRGLADARARHAGFWRDVGALHVDRMRLRARVEDLVHPVIGVVLSLALVLWAGWMVTSFLGRYLIARAERALLSMPGVRAVYPYSKQLVEFFFQEDKRKGLEFQSVVAVRYPSPHVWSYGFLTNRAPLSLCAATGEELVSVFVPSTPLPMSGFTINVSERELVVLPLSVDDALKMIVTGGVILPAHENPPRALPAGAAAGTGVVASRTPSSGATRPE
jgi:uncharacterized membrane protein